MAAADGNADVVVVTTDDLFATNFSIDFGHLLESFDDGPDKKGHES
jgi:hypothetical protein